MSIKKAPAMKARGMRFTDEQWKNLKAEAKATKATPSDILREMTDARYRRKK